MASRCPDTRPDAESVPPITNQPVCVAAPGSALADGVAEIAREDAAQRLRHVPRALPGCMP